MRLANFFGGQATMDRQGRVLVPPTVRERARLEGKVVVIRETDHLEIWNPDVFDQ